MHTLTRTFAGKVVLLEDYTVCNEGDTLTPEQARMLVSVRVQVLAILTKLVEM